MSTDGTNSSGKQRVTEFSSIITAISKFRLYTPNPWQCHTKSHYNTNAQPLGAQTPSASPNTTLARYTLV